MRKASHRGVWKAPWYGPHNEIVLYAVDSNNHLLTEPVTVPKGGDHVAIADGLWDLLKAAEPILGLALGQPPKSLRLHRSARLRLLPLNGTDPVVDVGP
jgi:hypothetical protein